MLRALIAALVICIALPSLAEVVVRGKGEVQVIGATTTTGATGSQAFTVAYAPRWSVVCEAASGTPTWTLAARMDASSAWVTVGTESSVIAAFFAGETAAYELQLSWSGNSGGAEIDCWAFAE